MSMRNAVKSDLDPKNPPALTAAALAAMPDSDIDYSDIPKQTAKVKWSRPGALVSSGNKQQITLRLNAVLREYVRAQRRSG
jgi:hypothetical protein